VLFSSGLPQHLVQIYDRLWARAHQGSLQHTSSLGSNRVCAAHQRARSRLDDLAIDLLCVVKARKSASHFSLCTCVAVWRSRGQSPCSISWRLTSFLVLKIFVEFSYVHTKRLPKVLQFLLNVHDQVAYVD
jgi:hypothetical protein